MILRLQLSDRCRDASDVGVPRARVASLPIQFAGFEHHLLQSRRPWRGLAGSVFAHCAFGCLGWLAGAYLDFREPRPTFDSRVREATSAYLQLRDIPLTFRSRRPVDTNTPEPKPRMIEPPRLESPARDAGGTLVRRFELPPTVKRTEAEQTLLQPDFPPEVAPPEKVRLPEFVFWAADVPKPARARKQMVMPGRKTPLVQEPALTSAPAVALPTESSSAQVLPASSVLNAAPKLPLPAPTAPLRTFQAPSRRALPTVALDAPPGEPSAILALHSNPAPMSSVVVVPGGNQIGKLPPSMRAEGGQVSARPEGAGRGTGGAAAGVNGAGVGASGDKAGEGSGTGTATLAGIGVTGGTVLAGSPQVQMAAPIQKTFPKAGAFDVVVAHPSAPPDVPNAKYRLKGTPVYTVYLNVGTNREWVLRYCATTPAERPVAAGNVVQLGNPAPIAPPYPQFTIVPPVNGNRSQIAVLHGFVTDKGQFRALEATRAEDEPLLRTLESHLAQWLFRPATRDGVAIEVEILLLLPHLL